MSDVKAETKNMFDEARRDYYSGPHIDYQIHDPRRVSRYRNRIELHDDEECHQNRSQAF